MASGFANLSAGVFQAAILSVETIVDLYTDRKSVV